MRLSKLSKISSAVVLAGAVAGGFLLAREPGKEQVESDAPEQKVSTVAGDVPTAPSAKASVVEPASNSSASNNKAFDLKLGLVNSSNYRAYIADSLKQPEIGGKFYAAMAYANCERLSYVKLESVGDPNPRRQLAINKIKSMQNACDGVLQQFGKPTEFMRVVTKEDQKPDVLLERGGTNIYGSVQKTPAAEQLAHALAADGDPYLASLILQRRIGELIAEKKVPISEDEKDTTLWYRAAAVVGCEISASCTDSFPIYIACATEGQCEDFRESLRSSVSKESRDAYDRIVQKVRQQIVGYPK